MYDRPERDPGNDEEKVDKCSSALVSINVARTRLTDNLTHLPEKNPKSVKRKIRFLHFFSAWTWDFFLAHPVANLCSQNEHSKLSHVRYNQMTALF